MALASTLALDGTADEGRFDPARAHRLPAQPRTHRRHPRVCAADGDACRFDGGMQSGQPSLMDKYEYVMYGASTLLSLPHRSRFHTRHASSPARVLFATRR